MGNVEKIGILAIVIAVVLIGVHPIVVTAAPGAVIEDSESPNHVVYGCWCAWKTPLAGALFLAGTGTVLATIIAERWTATRRTRHRAR